MDIYQENILDHYKNPRNWGEIEDADYIVESTNASCGDMVKFYFRVRDNKVVEVKYKCLGCSISTASSSLISEKLVGMTVNEVKNISSEDVLKILGIEISLSRLKCALLPLDAFRQLG